VSEELIVYAKKSSGLLEKYEGSLDSIDRSCDIGQVISLQEWHSV
jgi:hypothetical protein